MRTRYATVAEIAEIAEAAEVAPRTFFRYFATKEEVALALITEADEADEAIFPALEARPADEPPVTAFANAARTVVEQLMQADDGTGELWTCIVRLLENSPPLPAAYIQRALSIEDRLARKLAEREGVDPDTDLRPPFSPSARSARPCAPPITAGRLFPRARRRIWLGCASRPCRS
ncbi:TetR/AcrR family transcriptional regulator [Streptomyces sp. ME18-1-4]|uniref:TetR/AcrR family transcriptional regulator n=1 Tax=Streptomyces sp. ME18-1-4 TaxID=3028685 RepID=UPI0029ADFB06|nr:TetR family transcriptional regulator [Streptomyces sp. ME18-1-4]MDX3245324.1 TetR family transcriptional regulator [Streptomyces sp. ME18-1-4]